MKKVVWSFAVAVLLFSGFNADAQRDKKSAEQVVPPVLVDGMVYSLPRTGIEFTIIAKREQVIAGPYAAYAQKYLGITDVPTANKTTWKMVEIESDVFAEPDPSAVFKTKGEMASMVQLTGDGRIASIGGASSKMQIDDYSNISTLIHSAIPDVAFPDRSSEYFYDLGVDSNGVERMTFRSGEAKAREAADYIMDLRKKRTFHLIDSYDELPTDGKGYEVFVTEAKRLENIYLELFIGKVVVTEHVFKVVYIPDSEPVKNDVAFRFSDEKGVLPKTDLSGKPIVLSIQKEGIQAEKVTSSGTGNLVDLGINYRLPVIASFTLTDGSTPIFAQRLPIAQFGKVVPVAENFLNGHYQIEFDVNTGAIVRIAERK
jgi:hypothetical protein